MTKDAIEINDHSSDMNDSKKDLHVEYRKNEFNALEQKNDEMKEKANCTVTLDGNLQLRKYYCCQSILKDGNDHNMRTCKNILMRGKSPYTD